MNNIVFFIKEALLNIYRNTWMTIITIATISTSIIITGIFLLLTMLVETFAHQFKSEIIATVFLKPHVKSESINSLKLQLASIDEVKDLEVISPENAIKQLIIDGYSANVNDTITNELQNVIPYSIKIKIDSNISKEKINSIIDNIKQLPDVDWVGYSIELFEQIKEISKLLFSGSMLVIILLSLSSLFIVYNTLVLTLHLRRDEIIIMKLVGATDWFIRTPFIIEGFIHGISASIISIPVITAIYPIILTKISNLLPFITFSATRTALNKLCFKLFIFSVFLGLIGSILSVNNLSKFTKDQY